MEATRSTFERVVRHDRLMVAASLAVLTLLAWVWVLKGAGMEASAVEMTRLTLFPHSAGVPTADGGMMQSMNRPMAWSMSMWLMMIAMWWVMMIAMMIPSATPFFLLYTRVWHHAAQRGQAAGAAIPSTLLVAGYLAVWLAFSIVAASGQWLFEQFGLISGMLSSQSRYLSAGILLFAGVYQFTPLKRACLRHCRGPALLLSQHWRPGRLGAFQMGWRHGGYCVGCCWMLMALLFVGGVMNVAWIAVLALLVLAEKLMPVGGSVGKITGVALVAWGAATLFVG